MVAVAPFVFLSVYSMTSFPPVVVPNGLEVMDGGCDAVAAVITPKKRGGNRRRVFIGGTSL
jgi:hypothetical protein